MKLIAYFKDGTEETYAAANGCQVWRISKQTFESRPDTEHIAVEDSDSGELLKDLFYVETKKGMAMKDYSKKLHPAAEKALAVEAASKKPRKGGCIFITA